MYIHTAAATVNATGGQEVVDRRLLCFTHEGRVILVTENVIFQNKSMERAAEISIKCCLFQLNINTFGAIF